MSARNIRARLGLIDVVMLGGIAAGAVWLVLTHFTAIQPAAALLLAALAAAATFGAMSTGPATTAENPIAPDAPDEHPADAPPGH
ncbi:hypothetical protein [Actinomadura welshii]|uniref:hypothetical protein n=1 Tax=Actinomadura welshii TaxID=3103817 RepID=UPI0003ACFD00|nr:hypothetical protein [Actinomadura madurae]